MSPSGDGLLADIFLGRPRSRRYPKFNIRRDIPAAFPNDSKSLFALAQKFISFYDATWKEFVGRRNIAKITHKEVLERRGNSISAFTNVEHWFTREALLGTSITVEFGMKQQGFAREAVLIALSAKMRSIGNVDVT